jgi:hypothetical protein
MKMDAKEFNLKMSELLNDVPQCVGEFIITNSWERGHSAGHEEVYNIALGLKADLERVIAELKKSDSSDGITGKFIAAQHK